MKHQPTKYPRLAITTICEHHEDGGSYFTVQSHQSTHEEKAYPFRGLAHGWPTT